MRFMLKDLLGELDRTKPFKLYTRCLLKKIYILYTHVQFLKSFTNFSLRRLWRVVNKALRAAMQPCKTAFAEIPAAKIIKPKRLDAGPAQSSKDGEGGPRSSLALRTIATPALWSLGRPSTTIKFTSVGPRASLS